MATVHDMPTTHPLDRKRSLAVAVIAIGLCLVCESFMLATRGRLLEIAADFELELPFISMFAVSWVLPILLAAVTLLAVMIEFIPVRPHVADLCNAIIFVVALLVLSVYVVGIFSPLMSLMIGLS